MQGLYAFYEGVYAGRVVDSGVSSSGKWVTVLDGKGRGHTHDEKHWSYRRPEEMLVVDPGAVEDVRDRIRDLKDRIRRQGPEAGVLEGEVVGMVKVLDRLGLGADV